MYRYISSHITHQAKEHKCRPECLQFVSDEKFYTHTTHIQHSAVW